MAAGRKYFYTMMDADSGFLPLSFTLGKLLLDEEVSIGGVNFFGAAMWTDFQRRRFVRHRDRPLSNG
jgi:hypothetical protein